MTRMGQFIMSEVPEPVMRDAATSESPPQTAAPPVLLDPHRTAAEQWCELSIVLLVAVLPDLLSSLWAVYWASRSYESYASASNYSAQEGLLRAWPDFGLIGRSVQVSAVVLYLIWRSRERWSNFGFSTPKWFIDLALGPVIYGVNLAFYYGGYYVYAWTRYWISPMPTSYETDALGDTLAGLFPTPHSAPETFLLLVASCSNGFAEELVMRAYMIPRLERLLGSTWISLLVTTILFASYHTYQGVYGVFNAVIVGLVYGGAFCLIRRIWPVVVAHAIADVVGVLWSGG